ncbi:8766_t:CDS:2 [Diversispora eburnea]|uniref:Probable RNA polymerase II nuclear localization protein SLC7A6OS n=1 Tax=Diversispora eburnea TaxID=1213867 RepID=A0A9N8VL91_9GLOM|nr:8766_t:CDS:2 [Diversispora eburnea]
MSLIESKEQVSVPNDYTIIRLKRKRTEEPLDALVVQQLFGIGTNHNHKKKKPKRKGSLLVNNKLGKDEVLENEEQQETSLPFIFRFAETVDEISFIDSTKSQQLKDRIAKLINRKDSIKRKEPDIKHNREKKISMFKENVRKERYKVIDKNRQKKEEEVADELFKMYDAVKEDETTIKPKTWFDENEIFSNELSSQEEYVYSDEEDSNAEDYYKHDYPDEEILWSEQDGNSSDDDYFLKD